MVELQDKRIGLAAISARPVAEELQQVQKALAGDSALPYKRVLDVPIAIRFVVLLPLVGCSAGAAIVVQLTNRLAAPSKIAERFREPAPSTAAEAILVSHRHHEHMFPSQPDATRSQGWGLPPGSSSPSSRTGRSPVSAGRGQPLGIAVPGYADPDDGYRGVS